MKIVIGGEKSDYLLLIKQFIETSNPGIVVSGISTDKNEMLKILTNKPPDVVILEPHLSNGNSFRLLDKITERPFKFVLLSSDYHKIKEAVNSYKATFCLNTPFNIDEFNTALDILIEPKNPTQTIKPKSELIKIPILKKKIDINPNNIIFIKAEGSYSRFVLKDQEFIISKNLKKSLTYLDSNFIRIHHSYVINLKNAEIISGKTGVSFKMINGEIITISKRKRNSVISAIENSGNFKSQKVSLY